MVSAKINLNLGCNVTYKKNWVNLDNNKRFKTDIYHDLNKYPYPFKNKNFDIILASHIIEHLDNPTKCLKELERILKDNGTLYINVPHFTNPRSFTPVHKTFYSYTSLSAITKMKIIKTKLIFTPKYKWLEKFANKYPHFYEETPLRLIPVAEIRYILKKW